jgi:hypothetical protein
MEWYNKRVHVFTGRRNERHKFTGGKKVQQVRKELKNAHVRIITKLQNADIVVVPDSYDTDNWSHDTVREIYTISDFWHIIQDNPRPNHVRKGDELLLHPDDVWYSRLTNESHTESGKNDVQSSQHSGDTVLEDIIEKVFTDIEEDQKRVQKNLFVPDEVIHGAYVPTIAKQIMMYLNHPQITNNIQAIDAYVNKDECNGKSHSLLLLNRYYQFLKSVYDRVSYLTRVISETEDETKHVNADETKHVNADETKHVNENILSTVFRDFLSSFDQATAQPSNKTLHLSKRLLSNFNKTVDSINKCTETLIQEEVTENNIFHVQRVVFRFSLTSDEKDKKTALQTIRSVNHGAVIDNTDVDDIDDDELEHIYVKFEGYMKRRFSLRYHAVHWQGLEKFVPEGITANSEWLEREGESFFKRPNVLEFLTTFSNNYRSVWLLDDSHD